MRDVPAEGKNTSAPFTTTWARAPGTASSLVTDGATRIGGEEDEAHIRSRRLTFTRSEVVRLPHSSIASALSFRVLLGWDAQLGKGQRTLYGALLDEPMGTRELAPVSW